MSKEDSSFVIQLWWEVQPQMMPKRAMKELEGGDAPREEGGVSTRAGECVETLEHCVLKVTEGVKSGKERKSTLVELQTEEAEPVLGPGCSFNLGLTREDQGSRQTQWWNAGSGEGCGADLCAVQDQGASPKANEMELPHRLGPAGTTLGHITKG